MRRDGGLYLVKREAQESGNELLFTSDASRSLLVARRLEVSRGALLPGDCGLAGLFHQTAQAHLGGPQEFRITGLHERGQEDVKRAVHPRSSQNAISDRIHFGRSRLLLFVRVLEQTFEGLRSVKEPGWGDAKGCGQSLNCGSGWIYLLQFNLLKESRRYACCV